MEDDQSTSSLDLLEGVQEAVDGLFRLLERIEDVEDLEKWIELTGDEIDYLTESMPQLSRNKKKKCETFITKLIFIKHKFEDILKVGGDLQTSTITKEKVKYDDFNSAFNCRIKSG